MTTSATNDAPCNGTFLRCVPNLDVLAVKIPHNLWKCEVLPYFDLALVLSFRATCKTFKRLAASRLLALMERRAKLMLSRLLFRSCVHQRVTSTRSICVLDASADASRIAAVKHNVWTTLDHDISPPEDFVTYRLQDSFLAYLVGGSQFTENYESLTRRLDTLWADTDFYQPCVYCRSMVVLEGRFSMGRDHETSLTELLAAHLSGFSNKAQCVFHVNAVETDQGWFNQYSMTVRDGSLGAEAQISQLDHGETRVSLLRVPLFSVRFLEEMESISPPFEGFERLRELCEAVF
jgi:hypothetical protein